MVNGKNVSDLKVQVYLEGNTIHLHRNIFACTNIRKYRGSDILRGFIFTNERDFTSLKNLEPCFDFAFRR